MSSKIPPAKPIDFTYRYNPSNPKPFFIPQDWEAASIFLQGGNAIVSRFYDACKRGKYSDDMEPPIIEVSAMEAGEGPCGDDGLPIQMPFALMLGCSDARVPTELLFGQEFNDIFNIRVAGNVLAEEGIGSLLYALRSFSAPSEHPQVRSLRLAGVLGHRGCGAVKATVQTFQAGPTAAKIFGDPIGSIVSRIAAPPLAIAAELFDAQHGNGASNETRHFAELVELVVYLNAAWVAHQVQEWVNLEGPDTAERVGVVYGVFDPTDWRVHRVPATPQHPAPHTFDKPPRDVEDLRELGREVLVLLSEL